MKRKQTKTSSFGVSKRINHCSKQFYNSKLYSQYQINEEGKNKDNKIPKNKLNKLYCKSSETMNEIPDSSLALMITSPPYNVQKEYDKDLSLEQYRSLLKTVFTETYKKLVYGGRACINIANIGRKPYIPLHAYVIEDMLSIGYLMRGEILWNKAASSGVSCAWGSWQSASNPVLRDIHEYILIFSKGSFARKKENRKDSISKEQFLEYTKSIWTFPGAPAKRIGHPAPFPEELPKRLIELYSFEKDIVLDPFCGSGTTCIAATKTKRYFIAYDINSNYIGIAKKRIQALESELF